MTKTSQGKPHAQCFLEQQARERAYLAEMLSLLNERDTRPDPTWTPQDAARYRDIWNRHHDTPLPVTA